MSEWKKRKPKEDQLVLLLIERKIKDYTTGKKKIKQRAVCVGMYCRLLSDREPEYCEFVNNDFCEYLIPIYDKVIAWQPLPSMEV